jgi:hypothetical protein
MDKKFVLLIICLPGFLAGGNGYSQQRAQPAKRVQIGITFSQVQCEYLNLPWKNTYRQVLDMHFDIIRIGAYWSRIEKAKGQLDFRELDWQIRKAKERKIPVIVTVGMKAPRWPEFFIPAWLTPRLDLRTGAAVSDDTTLQKNVLRFIRAVIARYGNERIIVAWQVENEPLSRSGPRAWWIRKDFLKKEVDLVKKSDRYRRPIVINAMTYPNKLLGFLTRLAYPQNPAVETIDEAEIPAINIYPSIGQQVFSRKVCFWTSSKRRIGYIQQLIDQANARHKPLWVTELQAEPWEPAELVHVVKDEAMTCGPNSFRATFDELSKLRLPTIFLWGAEFWIYRQQQYNDSAWLDAFEQIKLKNDHDTFVSVDNGLIPPDQLQYLIKATTASVFLQPLPKMDLIAVNDKF